MSPETSLTIGFFVACLEHVDKIGDHLHPSASKSEFCVQKVSELATCEKQAENSADGERRKSHKRKKSKKEKTARLEGSETDATVEKDGVSSEADGEPQKSLSEKLNFVPAPTTVTVKTQHMRESRKLYKCKKSRKEKSAKLAKLDCSETEAAVGLDCADSIASQLSASDAIQMEQDIVSGRRTLHKHKKSKKEKNTEQSVKETAKSKLDIHASLCENGVVQNEENVVRGSKKSHKHKKSKKDKTVRTPE